MAEAPEVLPSLEALREHSMTPHEKPPCSNAASSAQGVGSSSPVDSPPPSLFARDQTLSTVSKFLKGKEQEWKAVTEREGPLTLLELPVDILRLIVKEMTHTNDLTALALTNSTLHNLAVPHIYARFDIVWPDGHVASSSSKSVDALTYGLSTLGLGSSFARTMQKLVSPGKLPALSRFTGNEYAKYTRNFSLGNGPDNWVAEYMITKESGKMLGTLVALVVAKMSNLETFVWDMPTGVLSDVFMALASLPEHHENNECKLSRVWIRWHDNSDNSGPSTSSAHPLVPPAAVVPIGSTLTPIGILLPANAAHPLPRAPFPYSEHHVEYPTFSVLPPVKSLTVLEIDELAYLDEMADLVERSKDQLQELRVGISAKASHKDFVQAWDGQGLHQIDHNARWYGESTIGERRLGGVLGVLVGKIYDIRRKATAKGKEKVYSEPSVVPELSTPPGASAPAEGQANGDTGITTNGPVSDAVAHVPNNDSAPTSSSQPQDPIESKSMKRLAPTEVSNSSKPHLGGRKRLEGKLKLHTLELERIPLSMQVCRHAIDWSVLSNLTILECAQHENLWKLLRKQFQPTPINNGFGISASKPFPNAAPQYHLSLKRIHTDLTSPALISFIKETLAPNTLEVLFLQDRRRGSGPPSVTIDQIFKGALKRHRSSLRKLLLDSAIKGTVHTSTATENTRWRNWLLTTEILAYITSGRMTNLRELAVSLAYKDWHTFLQRLPNLPQLRSLNIPYMADYIPEFEPKHLALQVIDIITLRPDIQLCYMGISTKCFEILETRPSDSGASGSANGSGSGPGGAQGASSQANGIGDGIAESTDGDNADEDETSEEEDDNEATDEEADDEDGTPTSPTDPDETQSENSDAEDSDDDSFVELDSASKVRLCLREILFYDDKVAIFKARHAKL